MDLVTVMHILMSAIQSFRFSPRSFLSSHILSGPRSESCRQMLPIYITKASVRTLTTERGKEASEYSEAALQELRNIVQKGKEGH